LYWFCEANVPSVVEGQNFFMYHVYLIKNDKDKLYVGITENLQKRINIHNAKQGALFTKTGNFQIVFYEDYQTLTEARRREVQIKNWRREKKENLINRFNKGLQTKPCKQNL